MIELVIVVGLVAALLIWSASTTCSLATFQPRATVRCQLSGEDAYRGLARALRQLPGVRVLEEREHEVLVSAMPVPGSLGRGYGLFVLARCLPGGEIVLSARRRIPLPGPDLAAALEHFERDARMQVSH